MFVSRALPGALQAFCCAIAFSATSVAQSEPGGGIATIKSARDPAAAEALFRAGRQLLLDSKFDDAFAKFEESYRLDPTAGALYNQGECRYRQGKTASAWALYHQAETLADVQGKPDHLELAAARVKELEGDLSYLTFHVAEPVPGLEILRDGVRVGRAQYDVSLPMDPGHHTISARAPGYEPVDIAVIVGEKRDRQTIAIPRLSQKLLPLPQPSAPPVRQEANIASKPNLGPWILGAAGGTSIIVGTITGLLAIHENQRMTDACPTRVNCPPSVVLAQGRRDLESNIAWVTIPVGLIALGSAPWLALLHEPERHPHPSQTSLTVDTVSNGRHVGLNIAGAF